METCKQMSAERGWQLLPDSGRIIITVTSTTVLRYILQAANRMSSFRMDALIPNTIIITSLDVTDLTRDMLVRKKCSCVSIYLLYR